MKVTAILPDRLIKEAQDLSNGKNITESLKIVLREWISLQKIKRLNRKIKQKPLKFDIDPFKIRSLNRKT